MMMKLNPVNTPVGIPVLENDTDPDGNDDLTINAIERQPYYGTATINPFSQKWHIHQIQLLWWRYIWI